MVIWMTEPNSTRGMMVNEYPFSITWSEGDGEYIAKCPPFPGLSAYGATEEEALAEAKVALEIFLQIYESEGIPLPEPTKPQENCRENRNHDRRRAT